jgi:hypothetical protein
LKGDESAVSEVAVKLIARESTGPVLA